MPVPKSFCQRRFTVTRAVKRVAFVREPVGKLKAPALAGGDGGDGGDGGTRPTTPRERIRACTTVLGA